MVWLCGVNCWFMGDCALLFFVKMVGNVIAFMSIRGCFLGLNGYGSPRKEKKIWSYSSDCLCAADDCSLG